ncbi:MAG: PAS domain S-box protein [Desulfuromonadales bacterium]|nr:PAS domain S-box protein [Desulfuromonadales bacterium]
MNLQLGILKKLILMHLLVFIVFASIILAVFLSFRDIETFSRTIINTDVNQVVVNAQLGRDLNAVFADTDLLISTFLNRDDDFRKTSARISAKAHALEKNVSSPQLKQALHNFTSTQQALFEQCATVHGYSRKLDQLEQQLSKEISALEGLLSEKLVNLAREGKDVSILEQISIIIPGYRETLLQIAIQHSKLRLKHPAAIEAKSGNENLVLLDDLHLRLRTLTASDPAIKGFGERLMRIVIEYKTTTQQFLQAMDELRNRLNLVNTDKENVQTAMGVADRTISQTAGNMGKDISSVMRSTGGFILLIAGGLIISLGFFTIFFSERNIHRPMQLILQGIESIRSGDLETRILLNRHDEWSDIEDALNRMVSERLRGEEALRESEQRLSATIQGSPIPTFVIGKELKVIYWNKALEQLSRTSAQDVIGTDQAWKAFYDEERPTLASLLALEDSSSIPLWYGNKFSRSRLVDGAYEAIDFFHKWGDDGKWLHFTAAVLRDTKGNLIGAIETLEDVTERMMAEKKWHSLFTNLPGGSYTVNDDYIIEEVNDVVCQMTGYTREELIGKPCGIICPKGPHHCPIFDLGKERIDNSETAIKAKDGTLIPIIKSARKLSVGNRDVIVENFQDITDRKLLEEQLGHAQKMDAVGQLAGGVAHDFNNILTAIIGYGNLLQMKLGGDETLGKYVTQILYSAERAANLTNSLLAFSRKHIINLKESSLNEIIGRAEKLLSRLVREDIELRVLTGPDCTIHADSLQIEQVLMNLVTNARDSMPEGGVLTISTEQVTLDDEFVRTHGYGEPGLFVVISIADSGVGMDDVVREKIFEPFFTTKETGKGTGLGLSIVYGIVKQHDGYIHVTSKPGKGSTFRIYLPVIAGSSKRLEVPKIKISPRGTETVLLAEDEPVVRTLTKSVLEEFGYTVIEAVDGADAVEKYRENLDRIQLVILDVIMPKKNGRQSYDSIRMIRPDVKALFMSGYTGDILNSRGILDENLTFVPKPLEQSTLLQKVREALDS